MREQIRHCTIDGFIFRLFDTGRYDWRGQTQLDYEVTAPNGTTVVGSDLCASPLHADDSDRTIAALCSFLSARHVWDGSEGDDPKLDHVAFCDAHSDALAVIQCAIDEDGETCVDL